MRLTRIHPGHGDAVGRLDIYLNGQWGTFCGITRGGAQAACRQLGFYNFIVFAPYNKTEDWPNIPIAIRNTNCDYAFTGALNHVLRCGYTTDTTGCTHRMDIVVRCAQSLWMHPYHTQVRLNAGNTTTELITSAPSSGVLEIFLNNEWGNVCNINQQAADSACRQMGYTNAIQITKTSKKSTDKVWSNDVSCGTSSCECLRSCIGKIPSSPTTCSDGNYVSVQCTYDASKATNLDAGSEDTCELNYNAGSCSGGNDGSDVNSIVIGVVVAIAVIVLLSCIVTTVVCFAVPTCILSRHVRGKGYQNVN